MKSCFIIKEGPIERRVIPFEKSATIGRAPELEIHLPDPTISRRHARAYLMDAKHIIEDLGSSNGTFVNGERIRKAVLSHGDTIQVGSVLLYFSEEKQSFSKYDLEKSAELALSDSSVALRGSGTLSTRPRKLIEEVREVPLFSCLDEKGLEEVTRAGRLAVYDRGKTIARQGDWGNSLYIILRGTVRVATYDHQGNDVTLHFLTEYQFFGESSLLTGRPHAFTAQAVQVSVLWKLGFAAIRKIMQQFPAIEDVLEQYQRERLKELRCQRNLAGLERRKYPRYHVELGVSLFVSHVSGGSSQGREEVYQTVSADVSITGIRIKVKERLVQKLPMGCQLRLEIFLPEPWESIQCLGTVRNMVETEDGQETVYLGIEFFEMLPGHKKQLEYYLYTAATAKIDHSAGLLG